MKLVVVTVATWAKFVQLAPAHRSTWYPVTPTLSVAAVHVTVIPTPDAVADGLVGAVGGVVSTTAGVVTDTVLEYELRLPAASFALTRYWYTVLAESEASL